MSDTPSEFFREILNRVPVQPLLRFRCVCKAWLKIIDDPAFIKSHLNRQSGGTQIIIKNSNGSKLYNLSLDSLTSSKTRTKTIWAERLETPTRNGVLRIPTLPVATCNGLILISHYHPEKSWTLRNPFTRDFLELPPYDEETCILRGGMACGGVGYDCVSDDYKVVRIAQIYSPDNKTPMLETLVYSLKLCYWRRVNDFPNCYIPSHGEHGVYVNGALHWRTFRKQRGQAMECIIAFDLVTENYRTMPLPSDLTEPKMSLGSDMYLDVLGECLFLSCCYWITRLDGWIMKDCGGIYSWTKLFSFTGLGSISAMGKLRPIAYLKNEGLVLLQHDHEEFFLYDVEKKSAKRFKIGGAPSYMCSQVLPASLFRLIDDGGSDEDDDDDASIEAIGTAGRKRKRKSAKDRLKLTLTNTNVYNDTDVWDFD
ncbi:hypothetical protein ACJIZ3_020625 [Penstemon smallii]|uniref:F-box domain-containing protein n=1 Tax=Penstemon smallii TaxID=265156 RepID=A0ABD3SJM5_9LAMI